MFRDDRTLTPEMFAFSPRDLVNIESDTWLYIDLFDTLDLSAFSGDYAPRGEEPLHPVLILRTLFYGLTHGIVTGRKLEDACRFDNRFIVLSGDQKPSYRTFYRFLIRHQERLNELFVQVVRLAQKMGLASLGRVAIDGSRFKANTSRHKAMSYERMQKAVKEIGAELEKLRADLAEQNGKEPTETTLPQEIQRREERLAKIQAAKEALEKEAETEPEAKAQKSFADLDALPMAKPKDGFMYGYNCQAAVDGDHQIIVAAEIHPSAADTEALIPVLDKVEQNCGQLPEQYLADAGYKSIENLEAVQSKGVTALIAIGKGEFNPERSHLEGLQWDEGANGYRCPADKLIPTKYRRQDGRVALRLGEPFCRDCPQMASCPLYAFSRGKDIVGVPKETHRQLIVEHQQRMRSEEGRAIYKRRKVIVEPVFGNLKNKGLLIRVRGNKNVSRWWKMVCTAHNLEKIIALSGAVVVLGKRIGEKIGYWLFGLRPNSQYPKFRTLCVTSS